MSEEKPIYPTDLELAILKKAKEERDASDGKYAPMVVKAIVYGILVAFAGGVVLGMGDLVSKAFIKTIDEKSQNEASAQSAAAAAATLYDVSK